MRAKSAIRQQWLNRLDNAMTIVWFAMDCCWMNEYMTAAYIMALLGAIIILATWSMMDHVDVKSDIAHMATTSWFVMNSFWMASEWSPMLKEVANLFMYFGMFLVVVMAVVDRDALAYFRRFRSHYLKK